MEICLKKDKCIVCGATSDITTSHSHSRIQSCIVPTNIFNTWKNECAKATCEILFQDKSEHFIKYFQDAEYCSVCEQLVRDICFIWKQLKHFQNQIEQLSTKMCTLIDLNYQQIPLKCSLKLLEERISSFLNKSLTKAGPFVSSVVVSKYTHEEFVEIINTVVNQPLQYGWIHGPDNSEESIGTKCEIEISADAEDYSYVEYCSDVEIDVQDQNNPTMEITSEIKEVTQVGKEKCKVGKTENASIYHSGSSLTLEKEDVLSNITQSKHLLRSNKSKPNTKKNPQKKEDCPAANGLPKVELLYNSQENNSTKKRTSPSTTKKVLPIKPEASPASRIIKGTLSAIRRKRRRGTENAKAAMSDSIPTLSQHSANSKTIIKKRKKKDITLQIPDHVTELQGETTTYKCNVCMKEFKTKAHGKYHEFCVNTTKPFNCDECGKGFVSKSHYDYHLITHTGERPHVCKECGKGFNSISKVNRHMDTHINMGEMPFICQECGKRFRKSESLNIHILLHKGEKLHECKYCKERYCLVESLRRHVRTHTTKGSFSCSHCDATYETKYELSLHSKTHIATLELDRKFTCSKCSKAFTNNKDLQRHILIHTGERPFKCPMCIFSFRRKDNLTRHLKNIHNITMKENKKCK